MLTEPVNANESCGYLCERCVCRAAAGGTTELTQEPSSHDAAAASAGKGKTTNLAKTEKTRGPRAVISLYYASALAGAGGGEDLGGAPSESRMRVAANNPRGAITLPFRVTFFFFFAFCLAFVFFLSPRSCRACRPGCLQVNCGADTLFEQRSAERNKYYCPVARPERRPIRLRQCWEGGRGRKEGENTCTHSEDIIWRLLTQN